jgi:FKBP-type peptidyl-prolyl cis-trans isomerase
MQNNRRINSKRFFLLAIPTILLISLYLIYLNWGMKSAKKDKEVYSEQYGYQLWEDIKKLPIELSLEEVILGMRASQEGREVPEEDDTIDEFLKKMAALRREKLDKQANDNLRRSEEYLAHIAQKPDIRVIEQSRLYYEIKQPGEGTWCIEPLSTAYFHYTITTLDNEEIVSTKTMHQAQKIDLATALPAFSRGVIGMKKGERRILYAHPDLAYRRVRHGVPPQVLVIIDVEAASEPG